MTPRKRPTLRTRLGLEPLEDRAVPATITVTTLADSGPGSLRAAVTQANADPAADTIVFDPSVRGGTVTLTAADPTTTAATSAQKLAGPSALVVTTPVTIQGTGETITRQSADNFRLFQVTSSGALTLQNLTLTGGLALGGNSDGGGSAGLGGAVENQGTLTITGSTLAGNSAVGGSTTGTGAGGAGLNGAGDAGGDGGGPNGGAVGTAGLKGTLGNPDGGPGGPGTAGHDGGFGGGGGRGGVGGLGGGTTNAAGTGGGGGKGGKGGTGGFGAGGGNGGHGGTGGVAENDLKGGAGGGGGDGGAGGFGGGGGAGGAGGESGVSTGSPAGRGNGGSDGPGGFAGSGSSTDAGAGSGFGGAIFNQGGTVTITDSTITANTASGGNAAGTGRHGGGFGGGIFNLDGTVTLLSTTVAENTVAEGTGGAGGPAFPSDGSELYTASVNVGADTPTQVALVTIADTILSRSAATGDAVVNDKDPASPGSSIINAIGPNIRFGGISSTGTDTGTAFTVTDPMLGSLADNGGPTKTLLPQTGSPAIDHGADTGGLATDQRGLPRVSGPAADIGSVEVQVTSPPPPMSPPPPPPPPMSPPPMSPPPPPATTARPFAVSGQSDGTARQFTPNGGTFQAGNPITAFPGFNGDVRVATADFNGDGVTDTVLVTGPGVPTRMAVISGKDGSVLVPPTDPFGDANFTFGGFVTAGDIDGDGRAEWVVTPELKGGPRVVIFHLLANGTFDLTSAGQPSLVANFFGIGDPSFRDGDRAALGDVNKDGVLDVFSIAAFNGGPRTALYDGKDVLAARSANRDPVKLVGDFFAAPDGQDEGRGGRSIAAGDVNGDGIADLIVTGDNLLGTGNEVTVYNGADLAAGKFPGGGAGMLADFMVSGQNPAALVSVAAVNTDGDARADLAVGSGAGQPSQVKVFAGTNLSGTTEPASMSFDPFGAVTTNGVFVG